MSVAPGGGGIVICIPGEQDGLPWHLAAGNREDGRSVPRARSSFLRASRLGGCFRGLL